MMTEQEDRWVLPPQPKGAQRDQRSGDEPKETDEPIDREGDYGPPEGQRDGGVPVAPVLPPSR
jgi:hypothetical protein